MWAGAERGARGIPWPSDSGAHVSYSFPAALFIGFPPCPAPRAVRLAAQKPRALFKILPDNPRCHVHATPRITLEGKGAGLGGSNRFSVPTNAPSAPRGGGGGQGSACRARSAERHSLLYSISPPRTRPFMRKGNIVSGAALPRSQAKALDLAARAGCRWQVWAARGRHLRLAIF